jgi:hypothetical protein
MKQDPLGRAASTRAALIPITKSDAWWELPQDERRQIFEETSHHVATGLEYLPAIARRLHHGRDLGEPFDFLTWFEFAREHASAFDELVDRLRQAQRLERGEWPSSSVVTDVFGTWAAARIAALQLDAAAHGVGAHEAAHEKAALRSPVKPGN